MEKEELLEMAIKFHGHKCPAMPLGLRAGWATLKKLGVERASNKELFCYLETGPAHAMMCFGDGVQVATGCTYGKANIEKLHYSKIGLILIDVKNKKAVRVSINPEFHKMAIGSQFVQMRKKGVEP
ncbi:MAG: FmdE family protein, partial [Candidatus Aminicenantales bacterium]